MSLRDVACPGALRGPGWALAEPNDGLIEEVGEHHEASQGLVETCLKAEHPGGLCAGDRDRYRFSYGWRIPTPTLV